MAEHCGVSGKKMAEPNKLGLPGKKGVHKPANTGLGTKPYPGTTKSKKTSKGY